MRFNSDSVKPEMDATNEILKNSPVSCSNKESTKQPSGSSGLSTNSRISFVIVIGRGLQTTPTQ